MSINNSNNDWFDFNIGEIITFKTLIMLLGFILASALIIYVLFMRQGGIDTDRSIVRHERTILVETLAEIPKGAFIHRIVDKELNKVCYLNAAGGGIECFDIDDLRVTDPKIIEKLLKQKNGYRQRPRYDYNTYTYPAKVEDTTINEE